MNYARAFAAGFVSTIVFHQSVIALFYLMGAFSRAPWSLAPVPPFGVPALISLSFWAGVWGVVLWPALKNAAGKAFWVRATALGAVGPTAVALLVVFPLKTGALNLDPKLVIGGLIVNAAWGFGLAVLIRAFRRAGF